ncbi:energy-coupling factor transporter transmembrane component T [Treponema sp. J25]|uniref:energy-coupling factor transporter transmembrane component T family protein n=1 Tax=Treponema sp. J25 TaxID=2094121 RepID=UPI00104D6994|nr:energy-coupling factor transporter transmembrane component T [Treponema sp. J25]TCW60393.1 hypothetical protein C5O22_11690 [Treponema sp. J25]
MVEKSVPPSSEPQGILLSQTNEGSPPLSHSLLSPSDHIFGRWRPNPLALLLGHLALMVPVFLAIDWYTPPLYMLIGYLVIRWSTGLSLKKLLRIVAPLSFLSVGLFLMNVLFPAEGVNGLHRGIAVFLRSLSLITLSSSYILAVHPYDLIRSLMQQWHLSYRWGYALFAGWNSIPLIRRDLELIQKAQDIRLAGQPARHRRQRLLRVPITLLSGVILHGERLSLSMAARGLENCQKRTFIREIPWTGRDWLYIILMGAGSFGLWYILIRSGLFRFELG